MVSRPTAWTVAIVAMLTMTVSYIDRQTLAVLAPTVTKALDISESQYGWLQSAFSIAYLVATPLSGWWIDRIGARRGLVGSILLWTTVSALQAIAPGFGSLFVLRIALGLAEGPSFPGAAQTNQRILHEQDRVRGFGILFTGSSIGAMIAPPLASYLYRETHSWRIAFAGSALVGLIWLPIWIAVTSQRGVPAQLDAIPENAPARAAVVTSPWEAFMNFLRELGAMFRRPNIVRAIAAVFSVASISGFVLMWAAKYLAREFHVKQGDVGHFLWLPPLIFDGATILMGDLASRQKRAPGQPPRLFFAFGALLAMSIAVLPLAETPWQSAVLLGVAMAGGGIVYTMVTADLLGRVAANEVSFAGGSIASAQSLVLIITSPLIGWTVDRFHSFDVACIGLAVWCVPGALYWLLKKPA